MKELKLEQISHSIGVKQLFEHLDFSIKTGEKIGLIGRNGSGKSTLLNIISGETIPKQGERLIPQQYRIAHLKQNTAFDEEATVLETVFASPQPLVQMVLHYEKVLYQLTENPENKKVQEKFTKAEAEMNRLDGWSVSSSAKAILSRLGIDDVTQKIKELSGGQVKRVALAQVLISEADLLLLDEPTNHLDLTTIQWLQNFIKNYKGAVLVVTHDRYFLDEVVQQIVELDFKKLTVYPGNYSAYIAKKQQLLDQLAAHQEKNRKLFKKELAWMREGVRARGTKQKARIQRFEKLKDQVKNSRSTQELTFDFKTPRLGKQVFELENVSFAFSKKQILRHFNLIVQRYERIGITGHNGTGKSTFLKLLAQKLTPDAGVIKIGETVRLGIYKQTFPAWDENKRVIEYLQEVAKNIKLKNEQQINLIQLLESFAFSKKMHGAYIRTLSGGEKRRLYLIRMLMEQPNVLLLDEPTNDLDIETLQIFENFLDDFRGSVIAVSHDRYFLDKISDKLLIFKGNGAIEEYFGSLADYAKKEQQVTPSQTPKKKKTMLKKDNASQEKTRLTYAEKKEWETIEQEIETIEEKLATIEEEMNAISEKVDQENHYGELMDLQEAKEENEQLLLEKMERWDYLSEYVN